MAKQKKKVEAIRTIKEQVFGLRGALVKASSECRENSVIEKIKAEKKANILTGKAEAFEQVVGLLSNILSGPKAPKPAAKKK